MAPTDTAHDERRRASSEGGLARRSSSSEGGFTLIEVLFAMVILTTSLVALAEMMAITLRMQMLGRNETAAVRLVQGKIDELVALDFYPVENALVTVGGSLTSDVAGYNDTPEPGFHRRWQVSAVACALECVGTQPRVRQLTVKVTPDVNDRRTNAEVQLTTFIRDP